MTYDPFEQAIEATLRERYGNPPAVEHLWEQVAFVVSAEPHPQLTPSRRNGILKRWEQWGALKQVAAIVIPLVLIVSLIGGTAFAVSNNLWGVLVHDQGAGGAYLNKLGKTVHLTQIHQGYTMTITWVYSDSIRTIFGYTGTGPSGHHFKSFNYASNDAVMQTDDGQQLPFLDGAFASTQNIAYFDTSALSKTSTTLTLHLTIAQITAEDDVSNGSTATPVVIAGPFHFDYTTPYYAGQTIAVPQTLSEHGKAVTLERVVVTPSAAQAYLKLSFPIVADEKFLGMFNAPHGAGNLGIYGGVGSRGDYDPATDMLRITSVQVSSQSTGQWSLEAHLYQLDQTPNPSGGKPGGDGTLLDVTFHFIVK